MKKKPAKKSVAKTSPKPIDKTPAALSKKKPSKRSADSNIGHKMQLSKVSILDDIVLTPVPQPSSRRSSLVAKEPAFVDLHTEFRNVHGKKPASKIDANRQRAEKVLARHVHELMSYPEVTAVYVGLKQTRKLVVTPNVYAICVEVRVKRKLSHPHLGVPIPKLIDGVPTDVILGRYRLSQGTVRQNQYFEKMRGGIAIRRKGADGFGTLGIKVFVSHKGSPFAEAILTNRHVVGDPGIPATPATVVQPILSESVPPSGTYNVGKVFASFLSPEVDCAIVQNSGARELLSNIYCNGELLLPGTFEFGSLTEADVTNKTKVFKVGAATGDQPLMPAVVTSISASVDTVLGKFTRVILADALQNQPIIAGGDSGSVLIKHITRTGDSRNIIVGLVFAEKLGGQRIVACHMDAVIRKLNAANIDIRLNSPA